MSVLLKAHYNILFFKLPVDFIFLQHVIKLDFELKINYHLT